MAWVVDEELTILSLDVKPNLCELSKPIEVHISYRFSSFSEVGAKWKLQVKVAPYASIGYFMYGAYLC